MMIFIFKRSVQKFDSAALTKQNTLADFSILTLPVKLHFCFLHLNSGFYWLTFFIASNCLSWLSSCDLSFFVQFKAEIP